MADGAGDPVGAGGTDGAASDGGAHMATSSPAGIACLTINDSRDLVMEDSQEPEGTARELGRQARSERKRTVTELIPFCREEPELQGARRLRGTRARRRAPPKVTPEPPAKAPRGWGACPHGVYPCCDECYAKDKELQ